MTDGQLDFDAAVRTLEDAKHRIHEHLSDTQAHIPDEERKALAKAAADIEENQQKIQDSEDQRNVDHAYSALQSARSSLQSAMSMVSEPMKSELNAILQSLPTNVSAAEARNIPAITDAATRTANGAVGSELVEDIINLGVDIADATSDVVSHISPAAGKMISKAAHNMEGLFKNNPDFLKKLGNYDFGDMGKALNNGHNETISHLGDEKLNTAAINTGNFKINAEKRVESRNVP